MLNVLDCDNQIVVAYKESGVLSQEDSSGDLDILRMVKQYVKEKYQKPGEAFIGLVHRLDRNTSGLMVFARTSKAASRLSEDIKKHNFNKSYLAVLCGNLKGKGTLRNYLKHDEKTNKSVVVKDNAGKEAILNYEVLDNTSLNGKDYSLVNIELVTGRHHQIRCQFSHLGFPLYGDFKYGGERCGNFLALSAYKLEFVHPTLKENRKYCYFKNENIFKCFSENIIEKHNLNK